MPTARGSSRTQTERKTPADFPEVVLDPPLTGWLQVLRNDSWDPATVRVLSVHADGAGARIDSPIPLPRTTKIMVNIPLQPSEPLNVQGVVASTRKSGNGSMAVIRFEHQAESDRTMLAAFAAATPAHEQPLDGRDADKRRHQRLTRNVSVQYQRLQGNGEIVPGEGQMTTLDIGSGGLKIRLDQCLGTGDLVYLHLPIDAVPFFSLCRVVWVEKSLEDDRYVAGMQFVDLSDAERERLGRLLDP